METKTIAISRRNGELEIGIEDRLTNLPPDRIQIAIADKYGCETLLALTADEMSQLRHALGDAILAAEIGTAPREITPQFQNFLDSI